MFTSEIHQKEIDAFYFNDFVTKLHPHLQTLALDTRVLHHTNEARQITSLADIYGGQYMLMPWLLDDIFQLLDSQRSRIAQAFTLFFMSYVIIDHLVDGQVPDAPMVALLCHHLLLAANEQFTAIFDMQHPFWDEYYRNVRDILNSLALEAYCLDRHQQTYTAEFVEEVSAAKAAPFRMLGYALALCSGQMEILPALNLAYNKLTLADQYGDDVADVRDDFLMKRATLPVVRFQEIERVSLEEAFTFTPDYLEDVLTKHGVLLDMCDQAIRALEMGIDALATIGYGESHLAKLLIFRLKEEEFRKRNVAAVALLRGFSRRLMT
jgi:hypothetical protein